MSIKSAMIVVLAVLAAGCGSDPSVDAPKPEAFARQVTVTPVSGGKLQRLTLPPALLTASKRRDLGDIRMFDAQGRLVVMALLDSAGEDAALTVDLPVYPVVSVSEGGQLRDAELSVRVESDGGIRAVTVDRQNADQRPIPAALLDTRKLGEPVASIVLKATIPAGRTVSFKLLTSTNLKDWEPLADKVLFRPSLEKPMLGGDRVELAGADLRGRFVGVSWAESGDVILDGASAILARPPEMARIAVPTAPLTLADPHELVLHLPDNGRLTGLRVTPAANDGIVPVRFSARSHGRDEWESFAGASISPERASTIDLPAVPLTSVKLEADRRTGGFSKAPQVELLFDPVELLVGFSGTPPYRLATGEPSAAPNFLKTADIAPGMTASELAKLPRAALASEGQLASPIDVQFDPGNSQDRRKWLLWTALLAGTLVLLWIGFRLVRAGSQGEPHEREGTSA